MDTYPKMREGKAPLPTSTGNQQPLWQALAAKAPRLAGLRVLALHAGDGWFCRHAINQGAIAVLGVDHDAQAISAARAVASSDRLRYRIMPDARLDLLSGPYDLILGTFDLRQDDLRRLTHLLSKLLRPGGHLLAAVATPLPAPSDRTGLEIKDIFTTKLAIEQLYQVSDQRLVPSAKLHFILSSRIRG
ncbi:class I SAM-dependent methyltransferase [Lacticaseibacillus absianus]|uniref:class I SAM-dependent methyltransferase n=1 Tax=Lacticaseibacillus absianus TaxID=2729623 RepID=UPI0015CDD64B|nr:methyltransferase domain-containing protein [Lacticaseibacillus absianus]